LVDQPPTVINVSLRSSSTAIVRPRGLRVAGSACSPEAAWTGPLVSARIGEVLTALHARTAYLDGEIAVLTAEGILDLYPLKRLAHAAGKLMG
jgi:hypothetical protein